MDFLGFATPKYFLCTPKHSKKEKQTNIRNLKYDIKVPFARISMFISFALGRRW